MQATTSTPHLSSYLPSPVIERSETISIDLKNGRLLEMQIDRLGRYLPSRSKFLSPSPVSYLHVILQAHNQNMKGKPRRLGQATESKTCYPY
jgi:hypothetical protein